MPDLKRLGENQARDLLGTLGVGAGMIYVDYQDRARLGAEYDQFAPYIVISSIPPMGGWIIPGTTVVLGIRAPEPGPQTAPAPTQPPAPPDQGQPPAQTNPAVPLPPTLPQPVPPEGRPQNP
jgi:peptidoglycan glycosyltransferase